MDVFYYWKNFAADRKADRLGYFHSSREKLTELADGYPNSIWVFKTPPGQKGKVQLLARLPWSDSAKRPFVKEPGQSYIYYDPDHADSLQFTNGETAIEATTAWLHRHFPKMIKSNFQGENGQQAMRGHMLKELEALAAGLQSAPFAEPS